MSTTTASGDGGLGNVVAKHYDNLPEKGKEQRKDSRIYFMRNFNNWIKSVLIQEYVEKIKEKRKENNPDERISLNVLDIACGKGGDLMKWQRSNVGHVVGVDIASTSIEQCKDRYRDMRERNRGRLFSGEFFAADCTKARIQESYQDKDIEFDLVSCQFAFHYCFESLPQAEKMLQNISENMRRGAFFVGTTPDSRDIMARLHNSSSNSFGNKVFSVSFPDDYDKSSAPALFGEKYTFHLEEVVDCPEFLVHFPTFVKLAEKYGLMLVAKERFQNFFNKKTENKRSETDQRKVDENKKLLNRMNALESYPNKSPVGGEDQYDHSQEELQTGDGRLFGTLTKDEWEALTIYIVFAFKKIN